MKNYGIIGNGVALVYALVPMFKLNRWVDRGINKLGCDIVRGGILGRRLLLASFGVIFFLTIKVGAATPVRVLTYEAAEFDLSGKKLLHIEGYHLSIKVIKNSRLKKLKLRVKRLSRPGDSKESLEKWNLKIKQDGRKLAIVIRGPHERDDWKELVAKGGGPKYEMEIHSPSLPMNIFINKGTISVKNWNASLHIVAHRGDSKVEGGEGPVTVFSRSGKSVVVSRLGKVDINSFNGQIRVLASKGQVNIENFAGRVLVKDVEGAVKLKIFKGVSQLNQVDGGLEFESEIGKVGIKRFKGRLRGQTKSGNIRAEVLPGSDSSLKSKTGEVKVRMRSGGYINAGTKEGVLYMPSSLKLTRYPNLKIRSGVLGKAKGGKLRVRTETGHIRVGI